MADSLTVRTSGLQELQTAMGQLGIRQEKVIRTRLLQEAGVIAKDLRSAIPHLSGDAASSVYAGMDSKGAFVSEGRGVPYMPFLDFGGSTGRGHQRGPNMGAVHRTWMGKGAGEGRYIYPQIRSHRDQTLHAVDQAIAEAAVSLGFETFGDGTQ
jgi:hypothetical protein